ncbi:MAG TPA: TatD family hydrolase [Candidatus Paceibacterota bacterium]|nr:TatD family hydrolase [Candidatus Paceibacterota bacterium]
MIFDSHTHLNLAAFDLDRESLIKKYLKQGIFLINVGTCYQTSYLAAELAKKYSNCWASIGLHPSHTFPSKKDEKEMNYSSEILKEEEFDKRFSKLLDRNKVIAVGECGLDYSYFKNFSSQKQIEYQEKEKKNFLAQIKVAKVKRLPMIFHLRNLYLEALEILSEEKFTGGGVFHFFSGTLEEAKKILREGYYLGFSGIITYSDKYDKIIKEVPIERILVETDAPYVAPFPYKGKRNEPLYVKEVIKKIADLKNLTFEEVENQTFKNTLELFRIKLNPDNNR